MFIALRIIEGEKQKRDVKHEQKTSVINKQQFSLIDVQWKKSRLRDSRTTPNGFSDRTSFPRSNDRFFAIPRNTIKSKSMKVIKDYERRKTLSFSFTLFTI